MFCILSLLIQSIGLKNIISKGYYEKSTKILNINFDTPTIGCIGSLFTSSYINTWYVKLNKPSFNPPNWLFAPVWTLLFILTGLSFYLVWKQNFGDRRNIAVGIYSIQLILNLSWSLLFFGLKTRL